MSSFTNALIIKDEGDGKYWSIQAPFRYCIGREDSGRYVEVPEGFKTDLASVPRAMQWIIPKLGKYNHAAVVHDYLYRHQVYWIKTAGRSRMTVTATRKKADDIFKEAMKVCGVGKWRRNLIYAGVRAGGWVGWNRYRNNS